MQKILFVTVVLFLINVSEFFSQSATDTTVYLLTCGQGTETYSIYGHSALRVLIPDKHIDNTYNWGEFDFNTPNFAWKFAKGRLDYMIFEEPLKGFLQGYFFEKRFVCSQKLNIDGKEKRKLIELINENLKPENVRYKYDFFYDNCSTRIRDLLEKSVGNKLLYPPVESGDIPTFRMLIGKYQNPYPWLKFGIDLLLGSPTDKKAAFRDRMFLPIEMKSELSETVINRSGNMIPLLQNPEVILDFSPPIMQQRFLISPAFIFTLLLIIIIILTTVFKSWMVANYVDIIIFSVFSMLAVLMIFFNFFTDHQQTKWNLNIIWLNPFIFLCLITLILKKTGSVWFRIVFYIVLAFLALNVFLPQEFNSAFFPLILILMERSSVRAGFKWNPLSIK